MSRSHPSSPAVLALAALCLSACEGGILDTLGDIIDPPPAHAPGLLAGGKFYYVCVGADDPQCDDANGRGDFPSVIALGSRFALQYDVPDGELIGGKPVETSSQARLSGGGTFLALESGSTPVVVLRDNGQVEDMVYVHVGAPDRLALLTDDGELGTELSLQPGDQVTVRPEPRDATDDPLAGLPEVEWKVDDDAVALVEPDPLTPLTATLRAVSPGQTTVTVTSGIAVTLTITVADPDAAGSTGDPAGSTGGP